MTRTQANTVAYTNIEELKDDLGNKITDDLGNDIFVIIQAVPFLPNWTKS